MTARRLIIFMLLGILSTAAGAVEIDQGIVELVDAGKEAAVVVRLHDAPDYRPANMQDMRGEKLQAIRQHVIKQQEKALSGLSIQQDRKENGQVNAASEQKDGQYDIMLGRKYAAINGFSGKITKQGLEKLMKNPAVRSIHTEKTFSVSMDTSSGMINATLAYPLVYNGINITGEGETVCVIDTGIDTDHPNLNSTILVQHCFCSITNLGAGGCCPDNTTEDSDAEDDHGHGTHVSGTIASQHTTYRGIAPGAKIAAMKVLNSNGNGATSDIISAIDWCVNNSASYNISVISMSLGGGLTNNQTLCDEDPLSAAANDAANNGIYVAVASGNGGNNDSIAYPACASNVTSVGAVYDANVGSKTWNTVPCTDSSTSADKVTCFTDQDEILDVMAPGSVITSTTRGGSTGDSSGTSMAAPHVSGAAALLIQFKKLENGTALLPQEIEDVLKNTAPVNVSRGGLSFPRIDVYETLLALDVQAPNLTFVFPSPANDSNVSATSIFINVSSSETVTNVILDFNGTNISMNGSSVAFFYNETNISLEEDYEFTVYGTDITNKTGMSETRTVHVMNSPPNITSYYPINLTPKANESENVTFNITYEDADGDLAMIVWYLDGANVSYDENYTFTSNYTANGTYNITVTAADGYNITGLEWNLTVLDINAPPEMNDIPDIEANESDIIDLTPYLNATDVDGDELTYGFGAPFNASGQWQTTYQDSGTYTMGVNVSDGNSSDETNVTVVIIEVEDIDNDGINDSDDFLVWNESYVVSTSQLSISINGSDNLSQAFNGILSMRFNKSNEVVIEFEYNFVSGNALNLSAVVINDTCSGAGGCLLVNGLENISKTVYMNNTTEEEYVCIKDTVVDSVTEISAACTGDNETLVSCDGSGTDGLNCSVSGSRYMITGINNSAINEQCGDGDGDGYGTGCALGSDCDDSDSSKTTSCGTSSSSSGGGGGGGGSAAVGKTISVTLSETTSQVVELAVNDKASFSVAGGSHSVTLKNIKTDSVLVDIASAPFQLTLKYDTPASVDVDKDGIKDIELTATFISAAKIKLTIAALIRPTCTDNIRNQGEDFTDCGGPCKPCPEAPEMPKDIGPVNEAPAKIVPAAVAEIIQDEKIPETPYLGMALWAGVVAFTVLASAFRTSRRHYRKHSHKRQNTEQK